MPTGEPTEAAPEQLVTIAERLYAGPVADFTAARDAEAAALEDRTLRARVKALKKPTVAAWAVNVLVRREADQIDQVLALAEGLRQAAASLDGDELRTLTRQRRQLTAALTATARTLAREYGVKITEAVADQVEGTLNAAMLDDVAAEVLRAGLVVTAFAATGVSEVDVTAVCAVPDALGHRAAPVAPPSPAGKPVLTVVNDDAVRVERARDRVHEATLARAAAEEEAENLGARVERFRARRLQLAGEIDELRRRLAGLEDEVDELDEELDEVTEAHEEALEVLTAAVTELDEAEQQLDRLQ